jgi:hypothetical protein
MTSMRVQHEIKELQQKVADLEGMEERFDKRMTTLERIWKRFKKAEGFKGNVEQDIKVPPRPKVLDAITQYPAKDKANG